MAIIRFPIKQATPGVVVCKPLNIAFPRLYRGRITTTRDDVLAADPALLEDNPQIPVEWTVYDLDTNRFRVVGTIEWHEVTHVDPKDQADSIVIRHHKSHAAAWGYISCVMDLESDLDEEQFNGGGIYQTDQGIFSLMLRPTHRDWPGPLAIYAADIPVEEPYQIQAWTHVVGPDGNVLEPAAAGF